MKYTNPCDGCSHCYQNSSLNNFKTTNKRWWHAFVPKKQTTLNEIDYSNVINEECGTYHELPISTTELHIESSNVDQSQIMDKSPPSLKVKMGN